MFSFEMGWTHQAAMIYADFWFPCWFMVYLPSCQGWWFTRIIAYLYTYEISTVMTSQIRFVCSTYVLLKSHWLVNDGSKIVGSCVQNVGHLLNLSGNKPRWSVYKLHWTTNSHMQLLGFAEGEALGRLRHVRGVQNLWDFTSQCIGDCHNPS